MSSHEDGFWWVVEGAVSEHGVEDAESAVGESDDGLVVAFALAAFAVIVGAAYRQVIALNATIPLIACEMH